jgi:SsrA-binding protein
MANKKKKSNPGRIIALNRQARHEYFIEDRFEAGIALEGWEVKSLRDGRVQLKESYVQFRKGEAYLTGCHISALPASSAQETLDPVRPRKLLMHRRELDSLRGSVERKGYTIVPLDMHWSKGIAKLEIGQAKGKQAHDKRATSRDRDWAREKQRLGKIR